MPPGGLNGFIKVRQNTPLPESVTKAGSKVVSRDEDDRGMELQCNFVKLDGLIKVRKDTRCSDLAHSSVIERHGPIRTSWGM